VRHVQEGGKYEIGSKSDSAKVSVIKKVSRVLIFKVIYRPFFAHIIMVVASKSLTYRISSYNDKI